MHALWERLEASDICVAFCTGRHLESIQNFYAEARTERRAAVCICMVGTDIWERSDSAIAVEAGAEAGARVSGGYVLDEAWHRIISEDWDKQAVEAILAGIPEATMQDEQWQSRFKSSSFLETNAEARLREIERGLQERGLRAKVVYSAGRYLDLLPVRSGKGEAVKYVAERLGVAARDVITCGDTGNDLDMMRPELGFQSIAVGNAAPELRAFRGPNVYHAQAEHAAGMLEGLRHYGWLD